MKNIINFIIALLCAVNLYGQSLAVKTGEQTSLYDAVCILNNITPGDIGMTEGRKLMAKYAESIGLNYKLFRANGGQNIHILHYDASVTISTSLGSDDIQPAPVVNKADTVKVAHAFDTMQINDIQPIEVKNLVVATNIVPTITLVQSPYVFTCDCRGKDVAELNQYYTELLRKRRKAHGLLKDKLDACSYQLRKYKKVLEREERVSARKDSTKIEESVSFEQILPDLGLSSSLVSNKPAVRGKQKKRRTRKLGRGHKRTRNNSFWAWLFPFRNC